MQFDKEILLSLGIHHKNIMFLIEKNLNSFSGTKELYFYIDNYFKENNLTKAFPVGISINEFIAHDSYHEYEKTIFKKNDLIKVDIGIVQDGNIIDAARTFEYKDNINSPYINDCKDIVLEIENLSKELIISEKKINIQKLSKKIYELIIEKGYFALDFLGGHNIEFGKVHGKKLILNKPIEKLPQNCHSFINKDEFLSQGEMFAIEVFIPSKIITNLSSSKLPFENGNMIQNIKKNITHFEIDRDILNNKSNLQYNLSEDTDDFTLDDINKTIDDLVNETKLLPFNQIIFKKYNYLIIKLLIEKKLIVTHFPLEWIDNNKRKLKYIQYEDCYLITNDEVICITR